MPNALTANLRAPELVRAREAHAVPVGHRGAPRLCPENTLESFQRAVELGAWMVELDVQQASDGTLVVFHDDDLMRMTGQEGTVASRDWAKLAKLHIDGWWRIPRLEAVLVALRERAWVNVEIKHADPERLVETLTATGMRDQVIVSSFDWDVLDALAKVDPTVQRALLTEARGDAPAELARRGARGWFPRADLADRETVEAVHAAGGYLMTWTVDDAAEARRLAELGVDAVCGNDVESLVAALS